MAAVVQSPSPFATLLRRSKFAAFDPAIAQVYTTYGGDAHRGNWGLKRPLPLRRRKAFIAIKSVDSPEQQTEWNHGENQARFIRRWEELGVDSRVGSNSPWDKRIGRESFATWMVDSEFAPSEEWKPLPSAEQIGPNAERTITVPNVKAMTPQAFQRYLEKLRKQRPEFQAYVQGLAENDPTGNLRDKSMYELAFSDKEYHKKFIGWKLANSLNSMESRNIEEKPHRTGGLTYSHTSQLQTLFTTSFKPGIVLQRTYQPSDRTRISRSEESFLASFAGLSSILRMRDAGGKTALLDVTAEEGIKREQVDNSITNLRLKKQPVLLMSPVVVGRKRQGLKGARIATEVVSDMKTDFRRANPHAPGSREYIGVQTVFAPSGNDRRPPPMDLRRRKRVVRGVQGLDGPNVIRTLRGIVRVGADVDEPL